MSAIQDFYPAEFAHCYGCGTANPNGYKLKSYLVDDVVRASFTIDSIYSGGFPENAYGGLLASLLDCHGTASAAAFAHKATERELGNGSNLARFVTGTLTVVYHKPTPLNVGLSIEGRLKSFANRKAIIELSLAANDIICVTGEMVAVQLPTDSE